MRLEVWWREMQRVSAMKEVGAGAVEVKRKMMWGDLKTNPHPTAMKSQQVYT